MVVNQCTSLLTSLTGAAGTGPPPSNYQEPARGEQTAAYSQEVERDTIEED